MITWQIWLDHPFKKKVQAKIQVYSLLLMQIWDRIIQNSRYPTDYFIIHDCGSKIILMHYQDKQKVNCYDSSQSFLPIISKYPESPILLVLHECDMEFRTINIETIGWRNKKMLINQVKNGEFSHIDWVFGKNAYYKNLTKNYWLAAVKVDDKLLEWEGKLKNLSNPFAGIKVFALEIANSNITNNELNDGWAIVVVQTPEFGQTGCELIVFRKQQIILKRIVSSTHLQELEKNILATMRFLQRFGYEEGEIVNILLPSTLNYPFSNPDFKITLYQQDYKVLLEQKFKQSFCTFIPNSLKNHYHAFLLATYAIRYSLPIIWLLIAFSLYFASCSYFLSYDYNLLQQNKNYYQKKLPENYEKILKLNQCFDQFCYAQSNNPSVILMTISKAYKNKAIIRKIEWEKDSTKKSLILSFKLPIKNNKDIQNHFENLLPLSWQGAEIKTTDTNVKIICPLFVSE